MKNLTSKEKYNKAQVLIQRIKELHQSEKPVRFMEVCGTHTVSIFREGIRQLLPKGVELVSGPGCPVCITDQHYLDKALAYAQDERVILATFGDMLKVPGSSSNLAEAKAAGANIHIIYTPLEVMELGRLYPDKKIIFLAIGFETTIAVIAATIKAVYESGLKNVFFLVSHKLVPPALKALLDNGKTHIDGFLLPGHVSVIVGEKPYDFLPRDYGMPCAIAGFEGLEILAAIVSLLEQIKENKPMVANTYKSVVAKTGNPVAMALMEEMYEAVDDTWRGIGVLPLSGLKLKAPYDCLDVEKAYPLTIDIQPYYTRGCQCGSVLQGMIQPTDCPLFGKVCTPNHAIGACMVSIEGSCAAWYKYGAVSGGTSWIEE